MTKENNLTMKLVFKNTIIYTAIILGCYFLYDYSNHDKNNIPHTDFSFVYAQF